MTAWITIYHDHSTICNEVNTEIAFTEMEMERHEAEKGRLEGGEKLRPLHVPQSWLAHASVWCGKHVTNRINTLLMTHIPRSCIT